MAGKTAPAKKAAAAARKAAAEARRKAVAAAAAKRRYALAARGGGLARQPLPVGRWMEPKALVGGGMSGYKQGCVRGGHKPDRGFPAAAAVAGFAPPLSYGARPTHTG